MGATPLADYLGSTFTEPVRDPVWGNIFLSPELVRLAATPSFSKLAGIKQLGPASLVYPGATHSRYAHSLGVLNTARRILLALDSRGGLPFASREGAASFLAAALCHDLGHFPFAHSLKELPLEEHEVLTARLVLEEPLRSAVGRTGADPALTAAIVDESLPDPGSRELRFYRRALSGVLDPDKLDYLNRDAYFCGVPYGVQDTEYILQRLVLAADERPGIEERGIMSVEGILFAKYLMYRSVYWHRGVRGATATVKKAVLLGLREGIIAPEELYGLDDAGFLSLLRSRPFPAFRRAGETLAGRLPRILLDLPYDPADPRHAALADPLERIRAEEGIAAAAGAGTLDPMDLVIDLPEPVSFESDLPVELEGGRNLPFSESSTVFAPPVVAGFTRALRRLRVFANGGGEALAAAARARLGRA